MPFPEDQAYFTGNRNQIKTLVDCGYSEIREVGKLKTAKLNKIFERDIQDIWDHVAESDHTMYQNLTHVKRPSDKSK